MCDKQVHPCNAQEYSQQCLVQTTAVKINVRSQHKILSENSLIVQISDTYPQACTALQSIGMRYKLALLQLLVYVWQAMNADANFVLSDLGYSEFHQQAVTGFVLLA